MIGRSGGPSSVSRASSEPDVLARIVAGVAVEIEDRRRRLPVEELAGRAGRTPAPRSLRDLLIARSPAVIAEVKRRSPSAGHIADISDVEGQVRAYGEGGAAGISIVTEGSNFRGSLEDLVVARSATRLPLLRKDFVIDPYQLLEARAAGADAVLLIAAALPASRLERLVAATNDLGMEPLVEAHTEAELDRALSAGVDLVGINVRDLATFHIDRGRFERLRKSVPAGVCVVAESGVRGPADVTAYVRAGADAVLVGGVVSASPDPRAVLAELVSAAKQEAGEAQPDGRGAPGGVGG